MGYEHCCQYEKQTSGEPLIPPHLKKEIRRKKMGSGQFWCHPASFLVPFLSSFVYTYEQHSDTGYKKQKADEQYYQLVSIHISNAIREAEHRLYVVIRNHIFQYLFRKIQLIFLKNQGKSVILFVRQDI